MYSQLKDLAHRLQAVIETAIDGIITIDSNGIVETINSSAAFQFGYNPDEILGQNIKMLMPEPYHSHHDGYLDNYIKTRKAKIIGIGREVTGLRKDGSQFPFRLAISEVILNDRVIFTGIVHDLSDVKTAEEELLRLNAQLELQIQDRTNELELAINRLLESNTILEQNKIELNLALSKEKELNELKSRFVSMASHEFRTPLSTIMSSASLISKYVDEAQNDKREKHVNRIKSAVNNLTGILNDFLSLSKIEEGKVIISEEDVNLDDLCLLVIDEVKGLLRKGQSIKHTTDASYVLQTDKRVLKNILFNLVSNAIKYSPENSEISCHISKEADNLVIQVEDQGIGIPKEEQKYLFERFFRASNVETIQGTGLGLNIVKRYVELLKGTITFKSELGKGTLFIVKIPLSP